MTTQTTPPIQKIIQRLCDSRIDTVGDEKPKSLVDTFWLNELNKHSYECDNCSDMGCDKCQ